ncbi:MAG: hypothetical protein LBS06_05015 [Treponema sp.]|jgi:hypothetical protein|nr:hypothetical protein [Treponema sp.]
MKKLTAIMLLLGLAWALHAGGSSESGTMGTGDSYGSGNDQGQLTNDLEKQLNEARRERRRMEQRLTEEKEKTDELENEAAAAYRSRRNLEKEKKSFKYLITGNADLDAGSDAAVFEEDFTLENIRFRPYVRYYKNSRVNVGLESDTEIRDSSVMYVKAQETLAYGFQHHLLEGLSVRVSNYNFFYPEGGQTDGWALPEVRFGTKVGNFRTEYLVSYPLRYTPEWEHDFRVGIYSRWIIFDSSAAFSGAIIYNNADFFRFDYERYTDDFYRQGWNGRAALEIPINFLMLGVDARMDARARYDFGAMLDIHIKSFSLRTRIPYGNMYTMEEDQMQWTPVIDIAWRFF